MSKKDFKIARRPGQGAVIRTPSASLEPEPKARTKRIATTADPASVGVGPTTRKTIEVPEDYFRQVKIRAVERNMLENELWSEMLS